MEITELIVLERFFKTVIPEPRINLFVKAISSSNFEHFTYTNNSFIRSLLFLPVQLLQKSHGSSGMLGTFASSVRYQHFSAKTPPRAFPASRAPIVPL